MKKHILLLIMPLVMVIIWFHQGGMLAWGEEGLPFYNAAKMWSLSRSSWVPTETGTFALDFYTRIFFAGLFLFSTYLHIPSFLFQAILFYVLMVGGIYSMYYLTKFFLKSYPFQDTVATIAAIFYFLNPYSMTQVWQRGLYALDFMFVLLPLGLLLFAYGLQKRDVHFSFLIVLASFICSTTFGLVTNIPVFWSTLFMYLVYWLFLHRNKRDIVFGTIFFSMTVVVWCLIHAWWIMPFFFFKQDLFGYKVSLTTNNVSTLLGVSQYFPFSSIIRLVQNFYFFSPGSYGPSYSYPIMQAISYISPIILAIGIICIQKVKYLRFFILTLFVGVVVSLGSNPPFGYFFVEIFKRISFLQAFKNPYEKYGIVVMFGYAPLFAFGLYTVTVLIKKYIFPKISIFVWIISFLFITSGVYVWPMWIGLYRVGLHVPQEYTTVNNWLAIHGTGNDSRVFVLPFRGEGLTNDWGYSGLESTVFTINKPVLSYVFQTAYTFDMFHNISNYLGQVDETPILSLMNARYIMTRNDVVGENWEHVTAFHTVLQPNQDLVSKPFCQNQYDTNAVICKIPCELVSNLNNAYVDIVLRTHIPSNISVELNDNGNQLAQWEDPGNIEYTTIQANQQKELLLPINSFSPKKAGQKFAPELIVHAAPFVDGQQTFVTISQVRLIPFSTKIVNKDTHVLTSGKLSLFSVNSKQFQEPITTLWLIREESTFRNFFIQAGLDEQQIAHTGYIVDGQNTTKNIEQFIRTQTKTRITSKKVSPTRYFIQVNPSQKTILAFNQTFSPQWKIIPVDNENALQNTIHNDIALIRSPSLSEGSHLVGNGYANFWFLPGGKKNYAIIFLPQVYADLGMYISIFTTSMVVLLLTIAIIKGKITKKLKK